MKQAPEHLLALIKPIVEGLGYECVGVEFNPHPKNGLLRIYIDKEKGVVLEDCSKVSHQISGVLDVEKPISTHYNLEVSSPGTNRPFFKLSQFEQYIGSIITINLLKPINKQRKITGQIESVKDTVVLLKQDNQLLEIPFRVMSKARLVPEYDIKKEERNGE